jgi:hypothetical protein
MRAFRKLSSVDPTMVELREWSRIDEELKAEHVRLRGSIPGTSTTSAAPGAPICQRWCKSKPFDFLGGFALSASCFGRPVPHGSEADCY